MKIDFHLLQKYQQGTCTPEELKALQLYFAADDLDDLHMLLKKEWEAATNNPKPTDLNLKEEIWAHLQQQGFRATGVKVVSLHRNTRMRTLRRSIAVAASIIGLILISIWLMDRLFQQQPFVEKANTTKEVQKITLADGSTVWLNRNSRITYNKNFNDRIRSVTLEGEAYFEVAKNPQKPFIVIADNVQTKVLGTSFNVKAFPDRQTIEVALVEGKVNVGLQQDTFVQSLDTLTPGELFAYHKQNESFITETFDKDAPYAWRQDIIHFQRANVQEVAQTLQDWYDITITIEQDTRIEGTLIHRYDTKKLTLRQVMNGISLVSDYRFQQVDTDHYVIIPK